VPDPAIDLSLLALAVILFVAYTAQTISGFGVVVIALTFSAHFMPIPLVLALVIPLSIAQCSYIAIRHHGAIDWRLLVGRILPLMGAGVAVGIVLAPRLEGGWLRTLFAVLVLVLSVRELYLLLGKPKAITRPLGPIPLVGMLLGAGVIHGIYATGGPMLVYAVNRVGLSKAAFRSTLTMVWIVLNTILLGSYIRDGAYNGATLEALLWLAPSVPLGLIVGELLHHRVDQRRFNIVTFALLSAAAVSLLVR
jgi:uncharacterized membrane protein YfcA